MGDKLREKIQSIAAHAQNAIFDFDQTLLKGDCSEVQFFDLIGRGLINTRRLKEKKLMPENSTLNVKEYYESLCKGVEQVNGRIYAHTWMIQALDGLSVGEILYALKSSCQQDQLEFNEKIVNTLGWFLENTNSVYIISASNRCTVQYLVQKKLNPLLVSKGFSEMKIENVWGIESEFLDNKEKIKIENNAINWDIFSNNLFTKNLLGAIPSGIGKVELMKQELNISSPSFVVTDSQNDMPLIDSAENALIVTENQSSWPKNQKFLFQNP